VGYRPGTVTTGIAGARPVSASDVKIISRVNRTLDVRSWSGTQYQRPR